MLLILFLMLLAGFSFSLYRKERDKNKEKDNLKESLEAELVTWRDKDSLSHGKILILESLKTKYFLDIKSKDSTIINLQSLVKTYKKRIDKGGSATQIGSETSIDADTETEVRDRDTIYRDNKIYIYPEYKGTFNLDNWVYGTVISNKDTTTVSLKTREEFDVILGTEKGKSYAEVISKNPYSEVKSFRTYQVKLPKPGRWGVGPSVTFGLNPELKTEFVIGVSLTYSLFRF